jgi:NADH-quinone oxidoreductase subunit B
VYAPGCPPSPQTLIHAIQTLHDTIQSGELTRRRAESADGGAGIEIAQPVGATPVRLSDRPVGARA